jgi:hypothetical protein
MDGQRCYAHYRSAVATCPRCGRGMCEECAARRDQGRCPDCAAKEHAWEAVAEQQESARLALRRAGVAVPRRAGEPIFLRAGGHPMVAGLCVALAILLAAGLGAATTEAELHWGIPRAVIAPGLAIVVGIVVSGVFGGTSRPAGMWAALLYLFAIASGPEALGMVTSGVALPGPSQSAMWLADHHAVALASYAVCAPLAYVAAAGRRVR